LLLIRMNAAETSASSAIADCTPLTVVSRSSTTAEIETFISDVSTTSTNIAIASSTGRRRAPPVRPCGAPSSAGSVTSRPSIAERLDPVLAVRHRSAVAIDSTIRSSDIAAPPRVWPWTTLRPAATVAQGRSDGSCSGPG
jgi:hypothetical protein